MKELSLNVLDIAKNSVKAGATLIGIRLDENAEMLTMTITDNGCGMKRQMLEDVVDPFCTTRTTRKVGMGIPLLKLASEQTGGEVTITSRHESEYPDEHGTEVVATFYKNHIDYTPLGDIVSTVITLLQGSPEIDWEFSHESEAFQVSMDTRQMREVLGNDVPLNEPSILSWVEEYLSEQYKNNIM